MVTNAQYPEQIRDLLPVTQLYISLDAPNKELLKRIDKPLFADYWERYQDSLKEVSKKKYRTAARLTMIKGINDIEPENYAKLINLGKPWFVEVKSYMYVGESQKYYNYENMPDSKEIRAFANELLEYLPNYQFAEEHYQSRVALLVRKDKLNERIIDFEKAFN
jgi:tRNA wybutosine-synthesizing protein 1